MQRLDWNDLRIALAAARTGALRGAADALGVDETTVSRRLKRLEAALGARLFERANGRLTPTDAGSALLNAAERMEAEAARAAEVASGADMRAEGRVRLTAAPIVANRLLAPATPLLAAAHPALELELVADPSNRDLAKREADLALRLARPRTGGDRVLARRVGDLRYGVFCAADLPKPPKMWIGYSETSSHLPPARWTDAAARGEPMAALKVEDAETLLEAAAAGLGKAALPMAIAGRDPRLVAISVDQPPPERPLWLLAHRDMARLARVRAVGDWIADAVLRSA